MFDYSRIVLISQASKVMLKILQAMLQQYVNWELSDIQAGFRKGRRTRDQVVNIHWISREQGNSRKKEKKKKYIYIYIYIYFCFTDYEKAFDCMITTNCRKFLKRWGKVLTLLVSWETCIQVKKQELESDMEQQSGSELEKE